MHDSRLGPLLIDSLDKPNAPNQAGVSMNRHTGKKTDQTGIVIVLMSTLGLLLSALTVFAMYRLSLEADYGNRLAVALVWLVYISPIVVIVSICVGGSITAFKWLYGWSTKNNLISLHEGPQVNVNAIRTIDYDQMMATLTQRMYDVAFENAKHSQYRGVQTLTLDQSTSNTTQHETGQVEGSKENSTNGGLYFNPVMLDAINK